ncbi:MAG: EscU/YscU/HrcU family type III secretion system export apparatus switch protein [Myxococcales bacterium]|nr:EscU/YscU/HrcU family type III secretion system export apparatus switch protein [Myxococcales bacterium]
MKDFRKRGEIAMSRDLVSAASLGGGVIALVACSGMAVKALLELARNTAMAADGRDVSWLPRASVEAFLRAAGPAMIGAAIASTIAILGQLGFPPAFKKLSFDLSRINPLANLPNTFGLAAMTRRTGTALAKVVLIGAIVWFALGSSMTSHGVDAGGLGAMAWRVVSRALWFVLGTLAALGAIDYLLARRRITGQMRMTADEIKREHRESDGDPMIKGKRKQRMRELAKRRMAANVAKADVVIVNPTHYAVALRYDEKQDRAPVVVAKGVDESAERIREVARKHGVPVLARPPLARALHKHVKEGRAVPANLYKAVAEVLAYVYRLRAGSRA